MASIPLLLQLLKRLSDEGVEFVVIGGVAAAIHGSPRATQDVDVCARLGEPNLSKILAALREIRPRLRMRPDKMPLPLDPECLRGLNNLYLDTDLGTIDFLSEVSGVGGFEDVSAHSAAIDVGGFHCRVLDLDALIAAKKAANRLKDRLALPELEAILRHFPKEPPRQ
jgi:predicted nucleotidyltransferase